MSATPEPITVSAECLAQLGGMEGSDPPVRFTDAKGRQWSWHPDDCDCNEDDMDWGDEFGERLDDGTGPLLLVEQSEPALLRVLARHLGWDGEGLPLLRLLQVFGEQRAPRWAVLSVGQRTGAASGWRCWLPTHISADLPYLEALAAAVTWYARVAVVGASPQERR